MKIDILCVLERGQGKGNLSLWSWNPLVRTWDGENMLNPLLQSQAVTQNEFVWHQKIQSDIGKLIVHIEANGKPYGDCHGVIMRPHFLLRGGVFVFGYAVHISTYW